jgi:hypothetical protein
MEMMGNKGIGGEVIIRKGIGYSFRKQIPYALCLLDLRDQLSFQPWRYSRFTNWFASSKLVIFIFFPSHISLMLRPG